MTVRAFGLAVAVCVLVPTIGSAQHTFVGGGVTHNGYPYGPRVAPGWSYPGLYGGPKEGRRKRRTVTAPAVWAA